MLHDRMTAIDRGMLGARGVTVGNLLELYLADHRRRKLSSYDSAKGYVANHLEPAFGAILAEKLTSVDVDRFIDKKLAAGYANASINRYLEALTRAFQLGQDAKPPLVHKFFKLTQLDERENVREGFLDYEEYRRMLAELPEHLKVVLVVGYHWGMRKGEILKLKWTQVDWVAGVLRLEVKQTKTKEARVVPLYGELKSWMERAFLGRREGEETIVSYNANDYEWPPEARLAGTGHGGRRIAPGAEKRPKATRDEAPGKPVSNVTRAWKTARVRAGLPELLVHDLRRSACMNMMAAGLSEKESMLISGHKTASMQRRYNITVERTIVASGDKMAAHQKVQEKEYRAKVRTKVRTVAAESKISKLSKGVMIQ